MSDEAREATHTYLAIEPNGRYRVMAGVSTVVTQDVNLLPVPADNRPHWLEIDSVPTPQARQALDALLQRAAERGWSWAARVRPERGVGMAMRDPVNVVVASNGSLSVPVPLSQSDPVSLQLHGPSADVVLDAAFRLAGTGCTVTMTSASFPASPPAPVAP